MKSLGLVTVTTHGTPVQLTATATKCRAIQIQPVKAGAASGTPPTPNTGHVYLMRGNVAKTTGLANCIFILYPDQPATTIPLSASDKHLDDLSEYWLDSDADGDGALISYA